MFPYPHPAVSTPMQPPTRAASFKGVVTQDIMDRAEVCYGDKTCRAKFAWLLGQMGLPNGLLVVIEGIEECGYVKDTGFVWLRQKKKKRHYCKFENVLVSYDNEVTAYFERNKIKNLTGVKAREFLIWITLSEIQARDAYSITFKTCAGLSKSFPLSLFRFQTKAEEVKRAVDHHQTDIQGEEVMVN